MGKLGPKLVDFFQMAKKKIRFRKNGSNLGSRNLFQAILYHLGKSHLTFFFRKKKKIDQPIPNERNPVFKNF